MEKTTGNALALKGRGELHLGILLENMRREGYELEFSSPTIIY
jgi:GTP-binding protein